MTSGSPDDTFNVSINVHKYKWEACFHRVCIGEGGYAYVHRTLLQPFGKVALKVFKCNSHPALKKLKDIRKMEQRAKEVEVLLKHSRHPNIVQIYGLLVYKSQNIGYVMEYMAAGSLCDFIHGHTPYYWEQMVSWTQQILQGISYLHNEGLMHRDIKPKNILLGPTHDDLKISDFGSARAAQSVSMSKTCGVGTHLYMAPEINICNKYDGFKADVFSFAITFWEIIHRKIPYHADENGIVYFDLLNRIMNGERPAINREYIFEYLKAPESLLPLIERSWHYDWSMRPAVSELLDIVNGWKEPALSQEHEESEDWIVHTFGLYQLDDSPANNPDVSIANIPDENNAVNRVGKCAGIENRDEPSDSIGRREKRGTDDSGFVENDLKEQQGKELVANTVEVSDNSLSFCSTQSSFDSDDETDDTTEADEEIQDDPNVGHFPRSEITSEAILDLEPNNSHSESESVPEEVETRIVSPEGKFSDILQKNLKQETLSKVLSKIARLLPSTQSKQEGYLFKESSRKLNFTLLCHSDFRIEDNIMFLTTNIFENLWRTRIKKPQLEFLGCNPSKRSLVREISAKTLRIALKSRTLYKSLHSGGEERFLKLRKNTEAQDSKQAEDFRVGHESCEATYLVARPDRLHTSEPIGTSIVIPITPDNDTVSNGFGRSTRHRENRKSSTRYNCIEIQPFTSITGLQEDSGHVNPEPSFEIISETNAQLEESAYGDAQMSDFTSRPAENHLLNAGDHKVSENTIDGKQEKEPAAVDIVEEMPTKAKAALEDLIIGEQDTDSPILEETFCKNSETSHESIEPTASNPLDFADRNESVLEPPVLLDFLMGILDPNEETAESPAPEESVGGSSQKQVAPTPSNRNKSVKCHLDKSVKLTGGPYEVSGRPTQKIRASKTRTLNYLLIFTKWSNSDYIYFYNRLKKTTQVFPLNTQFALKDYSVEFVNGEVYLFGGITPAGKLVKTTYKLNRALEWGKVKNMRHPRANFGSIAFDGKIWIFGGSNENCPMLDLVERYDSMLDEWTKVKSMHHARSNPAVTVVFGKIYVCGGNQTRVDLQENIELWDPVNELWTVFYRSMPPTQGDVYAHSAGCHLYITSEKREKATFWKIDVTASSSQWEETHAEKKKDILFIARTGVRESKVFGNVFLPQKWADGLGVRSFEGFKSVELQEGLLLDAIKTNPWISNVSEPFTTPRILLLGGIIGSERCDKIYLLNKECTSWRRLPFHLPSALSYHGAVYLEDKLYVFTGDVHGFAEDLFCLDNKNWEKKTSLLQKRRGISNSSVVFEKTIVVIGGEDKSGNALSTVERYDPSNNNCMWIDMPKLNIARKEAAATVVLGKIVVCGGKSSEGELLSSVELYEPSSLSWARINPMPPPTSSYSLSSIGSSVIAIGGDSSSKVWTLNMNSRPQQTWRSVAPLKMPSWNGCAIKFDRFKILAAGGYGTKKTEVFNGHNWTKGPKLPEEFYGMAVTISEDLATVLSTLIIFPIT